MHTLRYRAGDTIISEGEEGETAFLIVSGTVEVSVGEGKRSKILATLHSGEVFGEMCLIEPGPRSATVRAATETACRVTSYEEFMGSIQEDPATAVEFMRTLVQRLRQMNERMASVEDGKGGLRTLFRQHQSGKSRQSARLPHGDFSGASWWMKL
jgi:CRP/FNR family cyclic AMP-dependent transcriptional regulator